MFLQKRVYPAVVLLALASIAVPPARAQFVQQGAKLVGSGAVRNGSSSSCDPGSSQGPATALSSDGNTAIVGGDGDDSGNGAIWVFIRSGGAWSQQGGKLVGSAANNVNNIPGSPGFYGVCQGWSVAVSGDGNTLIDGGPNESKGAGTAWIFTRAAGTWHQQGPKLGVTDG